MEFDSQKFTSPDIPPTDMRDILILTDEPRNGTLIIKNVVGYYSNYHQRYVEYKDDTKNDGRFIFETVLGWKELE